MLQQGKHDRAEKTKMQRLIIIYTYGCAEDDEDVRRGLLEHLRMGHVDGAEGLADE